jgi:hypothetical protein
MLAAHFGASRNRFLREVGRRGAVRVLLALGVLVATLLVPMMLSLFGLGIWLGSTLPGRGAEAVIATAVTAASVGAGASSGAVGGAKQLTWESYRTFPVAPARIFVAELVSGFLDLIPLMAAAALLALFAGIATMHPRLIPWLALLELEAILTLLLVQLLVGSLAERAVKRLRVGLVLLGLAFFLAATLTSVMPTGALTGQPDALSPERIDAFLKGDSLYRRAIAGVPFTVAVTGLSDAMAGRWVLATVKHVYPIATLGLLALVARRMLERDANATIDESGAATKPWTFTTPTWGIARLQWHAMLESRMGRFGLVVPVIVFALVRGPLQQLRGPAPWSIAGAYVYLSLVSAQFQLNQFGFDGHGTKTLLLLPIEARAIFRGKALGLYAYQSVQAFTMTLLLALVFRAQLEQLCAGLLLFGAMAILANGIGRRTSVRLPRMFPRKGLRGNAAPLALVLVGLALSVVGGLLSVGTFWACARWAPRLLVPTCVTEVVVIALLHRLLAGDPERLLDDGRENLLAAI